MAKARTTKRKGTKRKAADEEVVEEQVEQSQEIPDSANTATQDDLPVDLQPETHEPELFDEPAETVDVTEEEGKSDRSHVVL